ncbi:MAG: hypothetical protein KAK04_11435, partial [Cyclobacteriaceae bacterium]|nr:hypothetical protein [Cyclobacteriaceae bacterium]
VFIECFRKFNLKRLSLENKLLSNLKNSGDDYKYLEKVRNCACRRGRELIVNPPRVKQVPFFHMRNL